MKTLRTLLIAGLILMVPIVKSYAGENDQIDQAYKQLNVQLKEMLKQSVTSVFKTAENTCLVVLSFTVNERHQMKNIRVESSDDEFAKFVKKYLKNKRLEVNPLFDGKSGQVVIML
jgi:hypothetical protein